MGKQTRRKKERKRPMQRKPRRGVGYYNTVHDGVNDPADATQAIKNEFGRRLQAAANTKGWNQTELARRATAFLPKPAPGQKRHKEVGRDAVSHYFRGKSMPNPVYLEALSSALGVAARDLLPPAVPSVFDNASPLSAKVLDSDRVQLRINRVVSMQTFQKIIDVLAEEDRMKQTVNLSAAFVEETCPS
jgi:transcriptional regulator with XRE-family HTH domain